MDFNQKLEGLYQLLVDDYDRLLAELCTTIAAPGTITNTNKFASLLVTLNNTQFITPLIDTISKSEKADV